MTSNMNTSDLKSSSSCRGNALEYVLTKIMREKDRRIALLEERLAEAEEDFAGLLEWTYDQGYIRCDRCDEMTLQETGFQCRRCEMVICVNCEPITIIDWNVGPTCTACRDSDSEEEEDDAEL